ncbi:MAG TPA: 50S ribosomal protein L19, partial [Prochlorococcus sp.]
MAADSKETSSSEENTKTTTTIEATSAVVTDVTSKGVEQVRLSADALIREFEASQLKSDLTEIYVGDTVRVGVRISEGNKERIQPYEGVVIA